MRKIINGIRNFFDRYKKPTMVQGYRTPSGELLKDTRISNLTEIESKKNLILADNVFIGHFNFIEASHGVTIEEGCQITNYISILSHSSHVSVRLYGSAYRSTDDPKGYVEGKYTSESTPLLVHIPPSCPTRLLGKAVLLVRIHW